MTLRAFLALLAGCAMTAVLEIAIAAMLKRWTPDWADVDRKLESDGFRLGAVIVRLGAAFLAAAAGGYVVAWGAKENPLAYVLALGVIVLVLAGLSSLQRRGQLPVWFVLAQIALAPVGVLAGGLARLRASGVLP